MVWVAALSSWTATLISLGAVWLHCKNYSQPNLQRWVVRIIVMVPVYALTAWATLVSVDSAYYLDAVRDIYEAFVIYCFVSLLISYYGGERAFLLAMRDQDPTPLFWPASLVRRELDLSDPYDYLFLKRGILQYVVVKPILAAATMLMKSLGAYHDGNWAITDGYLWTQLVYNASVSLSLYCLIFFYMATRESLAQWHPLPKFLCVKAIVFFSYWQGLGISILVGLGLIHDTPTLTADHIATFLQSWLICLEMIGGALGHCYSFSHLDYAPTSRLLGRVRLFYAIRDALSLKDVIVDAKNAWSGHMYTYRYFDSTADTDEPDAQRPVPVLHMPVTEEPSPSRSSGSTLSTPSSSQLDAADSLLSELHDPCIDQPSAHIAGLSATAPNSSQIKERRLRAGMRYTQGGKKTYWLPVESTDHRAVAFAAGGAGRVRAKLFHGVHTGTSLKDSAKFIGSSIHSSSPAMHESRRLQRHAAASSNEEHLSSPMSNPATEHTHLLPQSMADTSCCSSRDCLSVLSMDVDPNELASDDALYEEARGIESDFNYPVMEIGVAVGYSRRRPFGNTLPRHRITSEEEEEESPTATRPRIQNNHF
ncbi:DUF300-domain-containing protein [Coemansia reversa NRRL 1564]|uniref:DUF300-domain-containing protein n=1 Tax=Coemansia reversa (strain ATCC 12441 / NRRL 1564) TaxID=763665 RepID=A0A2G5BJ59_COERN|nr:DUF300-domain-containing protein [Coemansia reversa NRRL 1564]|eukprot:PIA19045.1 DUF300-domain-containing protein [Coemansia reversa NRRL 1564]